MNLCLEDEDASTTPSKLDRCGLVIGFDIALIMGKV